MKSFTRQVGTTNRYLNLSLYLCSDDGQAGNFGVALVGKVSKLEEESREGVMLMFLPTPKETENTMAHYKTKALGSIRTYIYHNT